MNIELKGSTSSVIQDVLEAQIGTQLIVMKALVDKGIVSGEGLLDALEQMAGASSSSPGVSNIIDFMAENLTAHFNRMNPPTLELTVIDGGRED